MADEGTALDMDAIDDAMGVWLESVEWVGVEYQEGEMPDVLELDLIEKADRSAAGRKAALARWGNRVASEADSDGATHQVMRGVAMNLSSDVAAQVEELLQPPSDESEIDQHLEVGPILLDQFQQGGGGMHWTGSSRGIAEIASGSRRGGRHLPIIVHAEYRGPRREAGRSALADEDEHTIPRGTEMRVTGIEVKTPDGWLSVLSDPVDIVLGEFRKSEGGYAELLDKADRSAAGRKAALARWGNRGPDSPEASAKRSEAARRAAATRRAKREAGESKGPETDEQAAARMGKEFEAKRSTGEPIDAVAEIAARDDYAEFIAKHADALGLKDTSDALKRTGVDEPRALERACDLIRASERRHEDQYIAMSGDQRASLTDTTNVFTRRGEVMTATPEDVAVRILKGDRCKSQFETARSRGALNPDIRAGQETAMFRVHPGMPPSARPTYGYVSAEMPTSDGPMMYGDIRFQLRDSVKERTTMTMGDSLGSPSVPVRMGSSVSERQASDSRGHGVRFFSGPDSFQTNNYAEAQIMGGWDRSDVTKVYVPNYRRFTDVDAAAAAAGITVEYY